MATELADAIKQARGTMRREEFCGAIGCGMASLVRWELGHGRPNSKAHRDALKRRGVPAGLLENPAPEQGRASNPATPDTGEAA